VLKTADPALPETVNTTGIPAGSVAPFTSVRITDTAARVADGPALLPALMSDLIDPATPVAVALAQSGVVIVIFVTAL
jgi:hypothetical protein